mmetsp:Transcript_44630/g.103082  ORF Transcript_44630/g.103082 Transcript_44630/m.103082 type:complete len:129 (+) Transcript_44630:72-458(+)
MGCTSSASAATTKGVQLSREHQLTLEHIRAQASLRQGAKGNLGQVRVRAADTFVDEDGDDMHSMNSSPPCMEDLEFAIPLPPDVSMTRAYVKKLEGAMRQIETDPARFQTRVQMRRDVEFEDIAKLSL